MARRTVEQVDEYDGPMLEVEDLRTNFRTPKGPVHAVDGVDLTLTRGQTLGIVGESGSGKTVLSRTLMGLLPSNAEVTGTIRYEGRELSPTDPKVMRAFWGTEMSMIFQDPMSSLNPVMKVGKQITESLRLHLDMSRKEANEQGVALLRSVGIPEPARRLKEYPHQLSGGMRQRVMIAIALACGPKILFADEPTTALDVTVQAQILDLLQEQQAERFMSIVLVTHDLGVVAGRADEIAVMYAGQVVERATAKTLFAEMRHPYTAALLNSIPRLDYKSHTRLEAIGGRPPDLLDPPKGCNFSPRCPSAQARCLVEEPRLTAGGAEGHLFACFYPVGTPEGDKALADNRAAGHSAAGTPVSINPGAAVEAS